MTKVQMRADYPAPKKSKETVKRKPRLGRLLDGSVYWLSLVGLSILSVAGVRFYLQPVDEILSSVFALSFVGMLFYVAIRNR